MKGGNPDGSGKKLDFRVIRHWKKDGGYDSAGKRDLYYGSSSGPG